VVEVLVVEVLVVAVLVVGGVPGHTPL